VEWIIYLNILCDMIFIVKLWFAHSMTEKVVLQSFLLIPCIQ
jgi:hypothetical protein